MIVKKFANIKPDRTTQRLVFLDVLRVFAFSSVLIGHELFGKLSDAANDPANHITLRFFYDFIKPFCVGGGAGVVVFFLVSGYIITKVLISESTSEFIIKRIFRIYPVYIFAVSLEIFFGYLVHKTNPPEVGVILSRMALVGDWFATPYGLAGVEWTLRIEIMFYAVMALLKGLNCWRRLDLFPFVLFGLTVALQVVAPFPMHSGWSNGYLTLYMPFLFVGSVFFLLENMLCKRLLGVSYIAYVFISYLIFLPKINPSFSGSHFAALALMFFMAIWILRKNIKISFLIMLLSDLTYSVYLFHAWLWDYIVNFMPNLGLKDGLVILEIVAILLMFCYFVHIFIEKPGIRVGVFFVNKIRRHNNVAVR